MKTKFGGAAALAVLLACAQSVVAGAITASASGQLRSNGAIARNLAVANSFDSSVLAALPAGNTASYTSLGTMISNEGLLGGAAPGAFFFGNNSTSNSGLHFSAVGDEPALNSGLAGSTALFVDKVGTPGGTNNLYYLGAPAESATDPNRVQFSATGATSTPLTLLRAVSFDSTGQAIQTSGGEKGGLSAGSFRLSFDPSLHVYGIRMIFTDTEINAATRTGISNVVVGGMPVGNTFPVAAGGNMNDYFVGMFGDAPLTQFDITLGFINASQTGGDAVLLNLNSIELIQVVPEPATMGLLLGGLALLRWRRRAAA